MSDTRRLDGQVAIVTGGAQGLGRRIALVLAEAGAKIVIGADLGNITTWSNCGGNVTDVHSTEVAVAAVRRHANAALSGVAYLQGARVCV